jgi:hypothetical protein
MPLVDTDPSGVAAIQRRGYPLANVWPIFSAEHHEQPRFYRELPARKPASPNTCVNLLTGGLLVRI